MQPWKVFSRDVWRSLQLSLIRIWIFLCLAGRGFVPGLTMVNIFTLVCCLKSKSTIGVEGESSYLSFLQGNGKRLFPGPQVPTKSAFLSDPSVFISWLSINAEWKCSWCAGSSPGLWESWGDGRGGVGQKWGLEHNFFNAWGNDLNIIHFPKKKDAVNCCFWVAQAEIQVQICSWVSLLNLCA